MDAFDFFVQMGLMGQPPDYQKQILLFRCDVLAKPFF
ncbi:hypothetical protein EB18_00304 [Enterococcus cecorum]|uniref:Uncharacterized protein n=1 Tax=Enterococcus cecorum TaxID=44008 RepID=A0A366SKS6_9ENTE|nr:hypothetical protein EB18_00304 [Enterococcus cecorum]RBR34906.1 hypothetical protein EB06_00307 [Enterococcus cecorum]